MESFTILLSYIYHTILQLVHFEKELCLFLFLSHFIEIPTFNASSVDPDQTPRSAAFDLDLHCLTMTRLWDAKHKWIKRGLL